MIMVHQLEEKENDMPIFFNNIEVNLQLLQNTACDQEKYNFYQVGLLHLKIYLNKTLCII